MIRILLTGGGTGGHITPLLAVTDELKKIAAAGNIDLEIRYFGSPGDFENLLTKERIEVSKILGTKLRRYFDLRNFIDVPKFIISIFQLLYRVFFYMPDVCFSKGGPGALAVVLVCRFYRIPVLIHESDSIPGLTSRILAKYARRIAISFETTRDYFTGNVALVGNPIRLSLLDGVPNQEVAKGLMGFDQIQPLILFFSGSQGATRINDFIIENLHDFLQEFQILHQTGSKNFEQFKKEVDLMTEGLPEKEKRKYKFFPYFEDNLKTAFSAANIIVSRAGSSSIFEIAAFGKPSILIPLPEAANDHQTKNAYEYAKTGAALIIESENLTPNVFINEIKKLLSDPQKLKSMSEAAKKFAKPEAARVIAEEIIKIGSRG